MIFKHIMTINFQSVYESIAQTHLIILKLC